MEWSEHVLGGVEHGGVSDVLEDAAGLLGLELGNLDLALDVLLLLDQLDVLVLLLHELLGVVHLLADGLLEGEQLLVLVQDAVQLIVALIDVLLLLRQRVHLGPHLPVVAHGVVQLVGELLLQLVEGLLRGGGLQLQLDQGLVALVDVLHELLVLDLQLMEVNELQVVAHLVLVLDLGLRLQDLALEGHVLALQLVDQLFLLLQLVEHVLAQLLGVILANAPVLRGRKETPEVEGLFPDLGNRKIGALEDGLQALEQSLGLVATLLDVCLEGLKFRRGDVVLLLGGQLGLLVSETLAQLLLLLLSLLVGAAVLLLLAEHVGLEQLVLTLDLLVVLLHGLQALDEHLHGEGFQVDVLVVQVGGCVGPVMKSPDIGCSSQEPQSVVA